MWSAGMTGWSVSGASGSIVHATDRVFDKRCLTNPGEKTLQDADASNVFRRSGIYESCDGERGTTSVEEVAAFFTLRVHAFAFHSNVDVSAKGRSVF